MKNNSVHIPLTVSDKAQLDELSIQMKISKTKIAELCFLWGMQKLINDGDNATVPVAFLQKRRPKGAE